MLVVVESRDYRWGMRPAGANLVLLLSALAIAGLVFIVFGLNESRPVKYSEFKSMIESGQVDSVTFTGESVTADVKPTEGETKIPQEVRTVAVPGDESLVKLLQDKNIPYGAESVSGCMGGSMLLTMLLLSVGLWFLLARPAGGAPPGIAAFGKSQAKLAPEEGIGVTFKDVAGIDEAEEELKEIVQFLKTPERFTRLGGRIPKGVLLIGPPGTGKTLLARAVAGEAGVPFFSISGSDFVEMFVGVGAARVRDLFKQAAERAPCIIFIDELDAIGKAREPNGIVGGQDERHQTLNQLLVEMDGFDGRKGIIMLAATNRPETLDPALLRAGRFDRQVVVDRPDVKGREAILRVHARNMRLAEDVDLKVVAQRTPGFSGADLANALNEAALLAARRAKEDIHLVDIEDAVERMVVGLEKKSRRLSQAERRVVAYHEAGHAVCAAGSPGADPVQKISIIPRGVGALGYTVTMPLEDRYLVSKQELINRLVVLYGGRASEELVFGDFTTGAADDISKASDLARRMVTQFGMSLLLGAVNYGADRPNPFGMGGAQRDVAISEETARAIDGEVRKLLDEAHVRARALVRVNRELMDAMTTILLEHEVIDGDTLKSLLARVLSDAPESHLAPGFASA
ncbi:MAG: ATP-dependent zinc metalloprotease FtsH [Pseudomonadota bacterium]|nr:ATP-dependent zinc metalloprotease FtsH [Pseudomonadota bacterium]